MHDKQGAWCEGTKPGYSWDYISFYNSQKLIRFSIDTFYWIEIWNRANIMVFGPFQPSGYQKRVKYSFLTIVFFITFIQYKNTFHLSYCTSLQHKVDIFIVRNFSIIFDIGFVPSVSKTLISLLFINIFAPFFFFW